MEIRSGAVQPVECISKGWELIKNDYWTFFGVSTVAMIIILVLALVVGFINQAISLGLMMAIGGGDLNRNAEMAGAGMVVVQVISTVLGLIGNIIVATCSGTMFCGIYAAMSKKSSTGFADFGQVFAGLSKVLPNLVYAVIMMLLQFALMLGAVAIFAVFGLTAGANGEGFEKVMAGMLGIAVVVGIIAILIAILISVLTTFVYPLLAERNVGGFEALMLSVRAGFANFGGLLLLAILNGLIAIGGFFACIVGILFVLPIMWAGIYAAYQDVFGRIGGELNQQPPPPPVWDNNPGGFQPGY